MNNVRTVRLLKAALRFRNNRERRSWRAAHRVADKAVPKFVNTMLFELRDTRNKINVARLSRAVASRNVTEIEASLLLPSLDENLKRKYRRQIRDVLNEAGVASVKLQPKVLASTFGRFDLTNPRSIAWAETKSSNLVREITEGTKRTIRRVIAQGFDEGNPVRRTARMLRSSIGLTERQWTSVANFQNREIREGATLGEAEQRADRFAQKVHRRRALNIARTETIDASFQGRQELWDQASDRGLIERDKVQRKWIVTPDDRLDEIICAPMAGQIRGMTDNFLTGDGRLIPGPTAHPQCRCDVILIIPGRSVFA